jgi:ketosteroid isomerase-like protein
MANTKQEIVDRAHAWMEAVQRKDISALEQILAPDYAYMATNHGRRTRAEWLATVPIYDIHRFELLESDVRDYGDVAVMLSRYRQDASVGGTPRSGEFLITDIWVRRDDRWQVTARSSILMAEAGSWT